MSFGLTEAWQGNVIGGCRLGDDDPVVSPVVDVGSTGELPRLVDLRAMTTPVENQGKFGSCVANAIVGALEYHVLLDKRPRLDLSRFFVWYNTRKMLGWEKENTGSGIQHGIAAILAHGVCPESVWPYMPSLAYTRPTDMAYQQAQAVSGVEYARIDGGVPHILKTLASGLPVVIGISLPREFYKEAAGNDGKISLPRGDWPEPSGGHAMLVVGYDLDAKLLIIRNSWGEQFANGGHLYMPIEIFERYGLTGHRAENPCHWAIGAISRRSGLSVRGPAMTAEAFAPNLGRPSEIAAGIGQPGGQAPASPLGGLSSASGISDRISSLRSDIRNRLRGSDGNGGQ